MAKSGDSYENSFIILTGAHQQCMQSHRTVLIDLNLERRIAQNETIYGMY